MYKYVTGETARIERVREISLRRIYDKFKEEGQRAKK